MTMWQIVPLCLSVAAAAPLSRILFSSEIADKYGAKCLDGSAAGYYLREMSGSSNWVMFLQGGGLCIDAIDCTKRAKSDLGSSTNWASTHDDNKNVLNSDLSENSFAGFNAVYVPYCSGDTYLGIKKTRNLPLGNLYTNGHLILEAILDHLYNTTSMRKRVDKFLFSGESAGGIGVLHNADWLTQIVTRKFGFDKAVVKASPQGGLFFPSRPSVGVCLYDDFKLLGERCTRADIFESWYVHHVDHAFVDESCAKGLGDPARCWDAGILARYVKTPLFFAQNRYDRFQIPHQMLCSDCTSDKNKVTKTARDYMAYFGNHSELTLRELDREFGHSVFMPNCYEHTDNLCMRGGPTIAGQSYGSALNDWFSNGKHESLYDDCGDFPCSKICDCNAHSMLVV